MRKTTKPRTNDANAGPRADVLKQGLLERRRQLQSAVQDRIRTGRARAAQEGTDDLEHSEQDVQNDMAMSLLQIQSEALLAIDAALARLDAGRYGLCAECECEITPARLRALPFAVRCQVCEEQQEESKSEALRTRHGRGNVARLIERPGA